MGIVEEKEGRDVDDRYTLLRFVFVPLYNLANTSGWSMESLSLV